MEQLFGVLLWLVAFFWKGANGQMMVNISPNHFLPLSQRMMASHLGSILIVPSPAEVHCYCRDSGKKFKASPSASGGCVVDCVKDVDGLNYLIWDQNTRRLSLYVLSAEGGVAIEAENITNFDPAFSGFFGQKRFYAATSDGSFFTFRYDCSPPEPDLEVADAIKYELQSLQKTISDLYLKVSSYGLRNLEDSLGSSSTKSLTDIAEHVSVIVRCAPIDAPTVLI